MKRIPFVLLVIVLAFSAASCLHLGRHARVSRHEGKMSSYVGKTPQEIVADLGSPRKITSNSEGITTEMFYLYDVNVGIFVRENADIPSYNHIFVGTTYFIENGLAVRYRYRYAKP